MKKLMTVVVSALCAAVAFGADYYVDYANGVDEEGRGGSDAPFKTIAYAIGRTDAQGHDVIHLMKGGHVVSGKLTLDHAVDLVGATDNPADTRVYRTKEPSASGMLDITAEGCFITGIDFDNAKKSRMNDYVLKVQHGTVSNCVIRGNSSTPNNGTAALHVTSADALAVDCVVSNNYSYGSYAGVLISAGVLERCHVCDNKARQNGGGVIVDGASALVRDCTIERNIAVYEWGEKGGGGVYFTQPGVVTNCVIRNNTSKYVSWNTQAYHHRGGGIYFGAAGKVYNSIIADNTAYYDGGAAYGSGTLVNCLLTGNVSQEAKGGATAGSTTLVNCTVVGNSSELGAGGVEGAAKVSNSILVDNLNATEGVVSNYTSAATIAYTLTAPLAEGEGNITGDPQFRGGSKQDYRLQSISPCVNTGSNGKYDATYPRVELAGLARILGPRIDMGAYEVDPTVMQRELNVYGDPIELGTPVPSYGKHEEFAVGDKIEFSVDERVSDSSGRTNGVCVGYVCEQRASWEATPVRNTGTTAKFTIESFAGIGNVWWKWEQIYIMRTTISGEGTVDVEAETEVTKGGLLTITATPAENSRFWGWTGDVPGGYQSSPTLVLAADRAKNVQACFCRDWYVDYKNGSEENDGYTAETARKRFDEVFSAANDGDTIYLLPGTHLISYDLPACNKAVTIKGLGASPKATVIDTNSKYKMINANHPLFRMENVELTRPKEGTGTMLDLTAGCVSNCYFYIHTGGHDGAPNGGVRLLGNDAEVVDCTFERLGSRAQSAIEVTAGCLHGSLITNCYSRGNGPLGLYGAAGRIYDCEIVKCHAGTDWGGMAGGLYVGAGGIVSNCVIRGCWVEKAGAKASQSGGGVYIASANALVTDCVIIDCRSHGPGGGIDARAAATVRNCLIARCASTNNVGGGVHATAAAKFINCTVADCTARGVGGIRGAATLRNSIVWNNFDVTDAEKPIESNWDTATFAYSCTRRLPDGEGNLCTDPRFFSRRKVGEYLVERKSSVGNGGEGQTWMGWRAYEVPGLMLLVR